MKVLVVGYGQLGRALAAALGGRGSHEVRVWTRSAVPEAERAPRVGHVRAADLADAARDAELVVLAVPDRAIAETAERLAALPVDWRGKAVLHAAGAQPPEVLSALASRGAATAVCHPLRALPAPSRLPTEGEAVFEGAPFTVDGTVAGAEAARRLVGELGGLALEARVADRALYHLAATIAANYGLLLRQWAARAFEASGLPPGEAALAAHALLANALENARLADADTAAPPITGPIRRGDLGTVRAHLARLSGSEVLAYAGLGLLLLDTVRRSRGGDLTVTSDGSEAGVRARGAAPRDVAAMTRALREAIERALDPERAAVPGRRS